LAKSVSKSEAARLAAALDLHLLVGRGADPGVGEPQAYNGIPVARDGNEVSRSASGQSVRLSVQPIAAWIGGIVDLDQQRATHTWAHSMELGYRFFQTIPEQRAEIERVAMEWCSTDDTPSEDLGVVLGTPSWSSTPYILRLDYLQDLYGPPRSQPISLRDPTPDGMAAALLKNHLAMHKLLHNVIARLARTASRDRLPGLPAKLHLQACIDVPGDVVQARNLVLLPLHAYSQARHTSPSSTKPNSQRPTAEYARVASEWSGGEGSPSALYLLDSSP
jgi:hypothetical protein